MPNKPNEPNVPNEPTSRTASQALKNYDAWLRRHPNADEQLHDRIEDILEDAGLTYDRVSVRIKDRDSFKAKLANDNYPEYVDFNSAYDLLGIRVITFHSSEIPQLTEALSDEFDIVSIIDKAAENARAGRFGYASQHLIVRDPIADKHGPALLEIQLRTVLQHAWAEFEHDIRYKNREDVDPQINRAFTLAAGLIELADQQFDMIAEHLEERKRAEIERAAPIEAASLPGEISSLVGEKYPTSRSEYYSYAVEMLATHGITTHGQLADLLSEEHVAALEEAMNYPYRPGQVRLIDDMLLFTCGRDHIKKTVHIGKYTESRPGRLGNRWQKLGQTTLKAASPSSD